MKLFRDRGRWILATSALLAGSLTIGPPSLRAADNVLTDQERKVGWILLFDGHSLAGWKTSSGMPSKRPVEDHCINPHKAGGYMMIHEKQWENFILSLDFKISRGCNSGVFVRTFPLTPLPGKDVGYNGIEAQILDTTTATMYDSGAIYDLVAPTKNAMKPVGQWNHYVITCNHNVISVELNGEKVARMDLDEWTEPNKRPDGTTHKFDRASRTIRARAISGCRTMAVIAGSETSNYCR